MGLREAPEHQRSARIRVQRKTIHRASFTVNPENIRLSQYVRSASPKG